MNLREKFSALLGLLSKLWFLVRPYGLAKAVGVLLIVLLQAILQVAGVTSIFPFLALAADPDSIRASNVGARVLAHLPPMDNQQLLMWAGCLSIAMLVVSNVANLLSDYVRARYAQGLGHWLRLQLLRKIASRPWSYFLGQNTSVLLKKTTWDVNHMILFVVLPILEGIARFATSIFLVLTFVAISPGIAIAAGLALAIYYVVVLIILRGPRRLLSQALREADRGAFRDAQQLLVGIKTVKIYGVEQFFIDRYAQHSRVQARVHSKTPLHYHSPKYLLEPFAFGAIVASVIVYAAAGRNLNEIIPVLGVVGLAGYRLLPAIQLLYSQIAVVGTNRHALDEVYSEFVSSEDGPAENAPIRMAGETIEPLQWSQAVRFEGVSFQYDAGSKPVLRDLVLSIPKHTSLGVVGKTGSGKSTFVDLLMGLHLPTAGRITVDGRPLTAEVMDSWQAGIGYVPQEIFLIDDTVARNIALGLPDAEIDPIRLREAAGAASILEFIEKELPGGFNATVGERGVRLSGGQRQRIALARALYRRPQLLILDEATSALDNETETQVVEAINKLQGRVTMVVVAHRLSTIERCERVLELNAGEGSLRPSLVGASSQVPA